MFKKFLITALLVLICQQSMSSSIAPVEIAPRATECELVYRQKMRKLEYREAGGQWIKLELLPKSPAEPQRWRGFLKNLKPETKYEIRAVDARGKNVTDSFVTQKLIPDNVLKLEPTFENCSFELPDHIGKSCSVEFRSRNGKWQETIPPVWFPDERCWRGALLQLKENTQYEVRAKLNDKLVTGNFKTWNSDLPAAKTVVIDKLPLTITESGKPGAYIRYTADKPLKGSLILDNVSYVILDNVTIDGDSCHVAVHLKNCTNVAVRNCDLSNFGCPSRRSWKTKLYGQYISMTREGVLYATCGIKVTKCTNVLIEKNIFHHPSGKTNSWKFAHPAGIEAIVMDCTKTGTVVRYNDFAATDIARWNDCIASIGNGCSDGGFGANADIYGNYFSFSNDDACELEGAGRNLRFYRNRIEQTFSGISTGRCSFGPVYIFRNLLVNGGDQHGHFSNSLKNGMQAQGKGTIFFLHNTVSAAHGGLAWIFGQYHKNAPIIPLPQFKGVSRGNIFYSRQDLFPSQFFLWKGDYDFDIIYPGTDNFKKFVAKHGQEKNAVWAKTEFVSPANGNYCLTQNSVGRDFAPYKYLDGVRHAGACQDDNIHALLNRPVSYTCDTASASTKGSSVEFTVNPTKDTPFKVMQNDSFYTVEPASGVFKAGVPQKFTVKADDSKMPLCRIYRGAFFIRQPDGASLPLGFAFDRRNNPVSGIEFANGDTVELTKDQAYFIYIKGFCRSGTAVVVINDQKIKVTLSPFKRHANEIIRLIDSKTKRLLRLPLSAGKYKIQITDGQKASVKIKNLIISSEPDLIYNGNLQEESK